MKLVATYDEEFMMKVLDGVEPTLEELKSMIRKATLTSEFFPAVCGTSFKNKGVKKMIDAVVDYLPSPLDIPMQKHTREKMKKLMCLQLTTILLQV